jgi:hypothetical protein
MIHRMLLGRRLIQLAACKLAAVIHRMLWWKKVCIPAAMQARCCDHRMLWWKKGVLSPAAMQARCCCCDTECSSKEGVLYPGHASCCCDPQNAGAKKVCIPALPCLARFTNALVQGRVCYPCAVMQAAVMITECSGGRRCYPLAAMQARCCCDPQNALVQEVCYPLPLLLL